MLVSDVHFNDTIWPEIFDEIFQNRVSKYVKMSFKNISILDMIVS